MVSVRRPIACLLALLPLAAAAAACDSGGNRPGRIEVQLPDRLADRLPRGNGQNWRLRNSVFSIDLAAPAPLTRVALRPPAGLVADIRGEWTSVFGDHARLREQDSAVWLDWFGQHYRFNYDGLEWYQPETGLRLTFEPPAGCRDRITLHDGDGRVYFQRIDCDAEALRADYRDVRASEARQSALALAGTVNLVGVVRVPWIGAAGNVRVSFDADGHFEQKLSFPGLGATSTDVGKRACSHRTDPPEPRLDALAQALGSLVRRGLLVGDLARVYGRERLLLLNEESSIPNYIIEVGSIPATGRVYVHADTGEVLTFKGTTLPFACAPSRTPLPTMEADFLDYFERDGMRIPARIAITTSEFGEATIEFDR